MVGMFSQKTHDTVLHDVSCRAAWVCCIVFQTRIVFSGSFLEGAARCMLFRTAESDGKSTLVGPNTLQFPHSNFPSVRRPGCGDTVLWSVTN